MMYHFYMSHQDLPLHHPVVFFKTLFIGDVLCLPLGDEYPEVTWARCSPTA